MPGIITQAGDPVDEKVEESSPEEEIRAIAQDIHKGLKRFKNSAILRIGVIAVAIKVVGVAGQIIIENQRLKAKERRLASDGVSSHKKQNDED